MDKTKGKMITISTELEEKMTEAFRNELDYRLFEEPEYAPEYQTEITVKIELLKLLGLNKIAKEYEKENKAIMDKYIPDIVYDDDNEGPSPAWQPLLDFLEKKTIDNDCYAWFIVNYGEVDSAEGAFAALCDYYDYDVEDIKEAIVELYLEDLYKDEIVRLEKTLEGKDID